MASKRINEAYFHWIAECCKAMGKDVRAGGKMVEDESWYFCYDDGMTPAQAVDEYYEKHPEVERTYADEQST